MATRRSGSQQATLLRGPERDILDDFLDWHRSTLPWKCAGLTNEQLALASLPPSNLSLLGIVRHMADMERAWFHIRFRGEALPRLYDDEDAALEHADPARGRGRLRGLHRGMRPGAPGGGSGIAGR
jgi:hypothetical protein